MSELTNNTRKIFASLATSKGRREQGMFMAQGTKCVTDTLDHFELVDILATDQWKHENPETAARYDITTVKPQDMERISTLTTPQGVIAIYKIPQSVEPKLNGKLSIALDGVQDPGNLGTIIRVADWMGVTDIIASHDTVDVWNPKVIQATMGAISRVRVYYTELPDFISAHAGIKVYGTFLDGKDIYKSQLSHEGLIVMGNEGKGIREETAGLVTDRLFIPPYPAGRETSESLNVAIATAITLSEFRRR